MSDVPTSGEGEPSPRTFLIFLIMLLSWLVNGFSDWFGAWAPEMV